MEQITSQTQKAAVQHPAYSSKYLTTFSFVRGSYGLRISVVGCMELTEFSTSEELVKGYIELRDDKVAVIDPRSLYHIDSTPVDGQTCIVLVDGKLGGEDIKVGVIVEDLSEVLNIASYNMDAGDTVKGSVNIDFILKLGRQGDVLELVKMIDTSMKAHEIFEHNYHMNNFV